MEEKQRIITVLIVVVIYNIIDRIFFHKHLTDSAVFISFIIAIVLYLVLIYFFGKKHLN
jgi:hypothetical protein